jgi:hypothetical protein
MDVAKNPLARSGITGAADLIESAPMLKRILFRWVLPAVTGTLVGLLALAFALQNEQNLSAPALAVFSPGLKLAEMLAPARHESFGPALSDFLRVAMGVNIAFYFTIFALAAYLVDRLRSR